MGDFIKKLWDNYYGWHLLTLIGILTVCGVLGVLLWIGTQLFGK